MFDIGWTEMMVIAVVAIVVVGPKELPGMLRTFGKTMGKVRRMSRDFQRQFDEALKEADLDEVRQGIEQVRKANPTHALKQAMSPISDEMTEVDRTAKAGTSTATAAAKSKTAEGAKVSPIDKPATEAPAKGASQSAATVGTPSVTPVGTPTSKPSAEPVESAGPPA